jgi:transcriptional regulator with XRE-family HTH domain
VERQISVWQSTLFILCNVDDTRVGSVIRAVRIRRGQRQADVAAAAAVSQAVVSTIENGRLEETSLRFVRRVAAVVGVSLPFAPRWRGAELASLLDEKHAVMVREVVGRLTAAGWRALPEHTFGIHGEVGSIDIFAWHPICRALVCVEVKTRVADLQDLLSKMDRKRRLAPALARELGWKPVLVGSLLVLPEATWARNAVSRFAAVFDAALPSRSAEIRHWLKRPDCDVRGIWFLNFAPGSTKGRPGGSMRVRPRRALAAKLASRLDESSARSPDLAAVGLRQIEPP